MSITSFIALSAACTFLLSTVVVAHELGHAITYWYITGKRTKIYFTWRKVYTGTKKEMQRLTDQQYCAVIYWGIIAGFMQLLFVLQWLWVAGIFLVPLYVYWCKSDIIKLGQYLKQVKAL